MDKNEFDSAFDEEGTPADEQSENAAFGIEDEPAAAAPQDVSGSADGGEAPMQAEDDAEAQASAGGEPPAEPGADPAMGQREKSWDGRLKKREAELKAREDAIAAREAALSEKDGKLAAGMEPTPEQSEGAEEATEAVVEAAKAQSPELAAAIAKLNDDFGDEFVALIQSVARGAASEAMGGIDLPKARSDVDAAIESLREDFGSSSAEMHFDAIAADHPDFEEVAESEPFKAYIDGLQGDERAAADRAIERGSWRSVVKLLDAYKASLDSKPADGDGEDPFADADEGVRTTAAVKLPGKPRASSDDYASAWEEAS